MELTETDITIIKNFITEKQESEILNIIPKPIKNETNERNNVYRYGNSKPYINGHISNDIPKVFKTLGIEGFDSVTINEYFPNQKLNFHVDSEFAGEQIVVLSLLGEADIDFENKTNKEIKNYLIERRSLYVFEGDMRWNWRHRAISKNLRYSVVFRKFTNRGIKNTKQITIKGL